MNASPSLWREIGLGSALPGFSNTKSCALREPGSYHAPGSFSFKAALKVQRKESNGVAGLAAAGSSLDRVKLRRLVPSQRLQLDDQRPRENAC
jgi:hypothetical protein